VKHSKIIMFENYH